MPLKLSGLTDLLSACRTAPERHGSGTALTCLMHLPSARANRPCAQGTDHPLHTVASEGREGAQHSFLFSMSASGKVSPWTLSFLRLFCRQVVLHRKQSNYSLKGPRRRIARCAERAGMRGPDIRAAWAGTSETVREHSAVALGLLKEHWLPATAAAAGLYCLWRFVRFIRWAYERHCTSC